MVLAPWVGVGVGIESLVVGFVVKVIDVLDLVGTIVVGIDFENVVVVAAFAVIDVVGVFHLVELAIEIIGATVVGVGGEGCGCEKTGSGGVDCYVA